MKSLMRQWKRLVADIRRQQILDHIELQKQHARAVEAYRRAQLGKAA